MKVELKRKNKLVRVPFGQVVFGAGWTVMTIAMQYNTGSENVLRGLFIAVKFAAGYIFENHSLQMFVAAAVSCG